MNNSLNTLQQDALLLLKELISIPSFSREEDGTASAIAKFLAVRQIEASRVGNNVFAKNKYFDPTKPSILLNSHHDTVKPNPQYSRNPFAPDEADGRLYGLGSNDAGGCLVSLIATFLHYYAINNLQYNLVLAATAEEEISGTGGIEYALQYLPPIDCAIVGEPTLMQMAVAERGLMVLDCVSHGKAGHAARNEGDNALYKALEDIEWFRTATLERISPLLGPSKMSVTVIETENKAHNVVPATCRFVVDTRINELYRFEEVVEWIRSHVKCEVTPRSMRMRSTSIALDHPLVAAGLKLERSYYGSPTTSDKALMPFPALKMGPGDSARSHTADEFIYVDEINAGIELYIKLLDQVVLPPTA
ncbi:MAG: M20 family metallo-hydrolase [Sphingobacteriales bacterium]|jgi:acetylornithine deacetylase|nr:M20 family metallo-hydrolase [Sphingobacteriales bacterium]NCT77049.1 M20 family metallo-hydrolase [Chitinophagaceae bacterium]OJW32834.1 MAG: acetylornithine deacetylase [Sphingobacteriales bacterium 46-32]